MEVSTVNMSVTERSLTSLNALIVTEWDITNREGNPEMTPVDGLRDNPIGSNPDVIEKDKSSPVIEGVAEKGRFFDRM